MKISACVITKNEAENLPRWLASMRVFADEMIVVDTGSTDATVDVARAGGAKVCHFDWINDFSAAKNFALDQAAGDWIVFTDADEYFTEESAPRVRPLIEDYAQRENFDGFIVHLVNIDMDTGALLGTNAQVQRIFRHAPHIRFVGSIHEHIENLSGEEREMTIAHGLTLYHTGYSPRIIKQKSQRDLELLLARRAKGEQKKLDEYHLMDCYYSLENYPQAADWARKAMESPYQPVGSEDRPYAILFQSLILMEADDAEITETYDAARKKFPNKADFPLIYGVYAWGKDYLSTAQAAYVEGVRLHEEYYREGDFSIRFAPLAYLRLGEMAEMRGDVSGAASFYEKAFRCSEKYAPAAAALVRLLARADADDTDVVETLNGLYDPHADAEFLAGFLAGLPFPRAALYYEGRSGKKLPLRRRFLLAGDAKSAAASLIEDMERTSAIAAAGLPALSAETQASLALLLPHSCTQQSAKAEAQRMQRRIARLAEVYS